MNINSTMKKLQKAILQTGLAIAISKSQFYSCEQNRFIPIITLTTRVSKYSEKSKEWKEATYEILKTSSQIDALLCMVDIHKAVSV